MSTHALFHTVSIWGVGLLGGSLGLALREHALAKRVIGIGRNEEKLRAAKEMGALDEYALDLSEGFADADLAVLCTPVAVLAESLPRLAPMFKPGAIVTDVGSTKKRIVEAAESALSSSTLFVGSHPMSGAEVSGCAHARSELYRNNPCFITPTPNTDLNALSILRRFWNAVGSRVIVTDPQRHDMLTATMSHAPHLASAAIALLTRGLGEDENLLASIAGKGFWDTTRLAKGDLAMWSEICRENPEEIVAQLDRLMALLGDIRNRIDRDGDVEAWLRQARDARMELDGLRKSATENHS